LNEAKQIHGNKITTLQGSVYNLPKKQKYDIAQMIRVSHHIDDLPLVLKQINNALNPSGYLIIEIANKRHLLEIIRFLFGKSKLSPFDRNPESRNEKGFFNYHAKYVEHLFKEQKWQTRKRLSVSSFRSALLKKILGHKLLSSLEFLFQEPLSLFTLSPSIYYLLQKED